MIRRNSRKIAVLLMTVCVAAVGCKKEVKPVPSTAKPAKPVPQTVQKQSSSAKGASSKETQKQVSSSRTPLKGVQQQTSSMKRIAVAGTQLDFSVKKDPFKPYIVQPVAPVKKEPGLGKNVNALPIQSFDVNKFALVGIIAGLKENRALIVDPFRKGYVVKAGMLLGNNNGRITRISGDAVEVLEQFRDDNGKLRKRTVRLVLPQKK
jgi:type IV pilus assembly protein PilP